MIPKLLPLSIGALAVSLVAFQAMAQSVLPANIQADRTTIQQDQLLAESIVQQLRVDEANGNLAAAEADRTAIRLAHLKTKQDMAQLHQDAQPILQPEQAALTAALTQLYNDQHANNAGALTADQAAVTAAESQLKADREAIFGALGKTFEAPRGHHRGE